MNIARFSVHRPVFTVMVTLIVLILGGVSLVFLPVDLMPDITLPTLSVSTSYENASPEVIEELVTRPIEQALAAAPDVEEVSSSSSEGRSNVRITFAWGTNLDAAVNDIRDRLDRVIPRLPDDADRPRLHKFDLSSFPILILGSSSNLDPVQARRIIDDNVSYRLERVPGVAAVDIWGGLDREIHVALDPDKLKAMDIPLDQLVARIRAANVMQPAGEIETGNYEISLRTSGEYASLEELRDTVVATRNGVPVRVRDVSQVEDGWKKVTRIVRVNGKTGVRLSINKQSGKNTVEVARGVLKEIAAINEDIPQINITPIIDTSDYIQRSIVNVGTAALFGGVFAIIILLIFLRSLRSTAIISVAIPISIVATFALIYFSGFTLNLMTLGGLALGVGMLVDNSIVVLENIYRLRQTGEGAEEAAIHGTTEVTAAIIASTLTTVVVFLPLVFIRGMAGVMFKQLACVVGFALLCALVVALTLIPMLASRFLHTTTLARTKGETLGHRVFRVTGIFLEHLERDYKALLHLALRHRVLVAALAILLLGSSLALIPLIGRELMPQSDEGQVRVSVEMEVGTRLGVTDATITPMEELVAREVPETRNVVTSVGGGFGSSGSYSANIQIALKPQSQRERSSEEVAAHLRKALSAVPGATVRIRVGQGMFLLRRMSGGSERVEIEIRGYDLETADALAARVKEIVEDVDGVTDAVISRDTGAPERLIVVDRDKAEAMRVTVKQVADALRTAVSGTVAGTYREGGDEFSIRVQLSGAEHRDMREILDLTVTNAAGTPVVLRNVVSVGSRTGPVRIERKDQERIVSVRANIQDRDMSSIITDIRERLHAVPVPRGFAIGFAGDYEEQQKAFKELLLGFVLALIFVYMVMACLYESLRDPFIVMFSVPLAIIGVVLMLFLTNTTFNLQSYIGCIMLGGIVVNNAILLVDYTNLLRRKGMGLKEAIEEAGRRRLRPILMTALTTSFGLLPLALGLGEGGEAQAPLARTVIGGLLSSSLITLIFVPVVYSFFERNSAHEENGPRAVPREHEAMEDCP